MFVEICVMLLRFVIYYRSSRNPVYGISSGPATLPGLRSFKRDTMPPVLKVMLDIAG